MNQTLWPDWHEAFVHTEKRGRWHQRVMGYRLLPFCAYHAQWLEVVESPLWVRSEKRASLADLYLAARICACDFGEVPDVIKKPNLWHKLHFTARAVMGKGQFDRWTAYQADYVSSPMRAAAKRPDRKDDPIYQKTGKMRRNQTVKCSAADYANIPDNLLLVAGLMHLGRVSAREAWMMPFGQAEWLLSALHMQAGHESGVMGEHDREFMRGMKLGRWKEVSLP